MRSYTVELVSRYRSSPAIYGWEFGNEFALSTDLIQNYADKMAPIEPQLGTPKFRTQADYLTHGEIFTAMRTGPSSFSLAACPGGARCPDPGTAGHLQAAYAGELARGGPDPALLRHRGTRLGDGRHRSPRDSGNALSSAGIRDVLIATLLSGRVGGAGLRLRRHPHGHRVSLVRLSSSPRCCRLRRRCVPGRCR